MKGIILAGGTGSRLYPITHAVCKQLLPIYNKPMIYYPLSHLIEAGIREILLIVNPSDLSSFKKLLEDGSHLGISLSYALQEKPKGIADALLLGEDFLNGDPCSLLLGDNIFFNSPLQKILSEKNERVHGATVFALEVNNPSDYGVVTFSKEKKALFLSEKPNPSPSPFAVLGLYLYDQRASTFAKLVRPSKRGELEITDLNTLYLEKKELTVSVLEKGSRWFDCGSFDHLLSASRLVKEIEEESRLPFGSPEFASLNKGWITEKQFHALAEKQKGSSYGSLLQNIKIQEVVF